jgi:heptosyltransferase-2
VGSAPQNIIVRGVNWLGDAVMSTPALFRLRERFPAAQIVLLTPEKIEQLWIGHPAINRTLSFGPAETLVSVSKRLRDEAFDLALILPNSFRSAAEMFFSRIPRRVGYGGQLRSLFLTQPVGKRPQSISMRKRTRGKIERLVANGRESDPTTIPATAHHIHQYLHLAAAVEASAKPIAPMIHVAETEVTEVCKKFEISRDEIPLIGINPGAEYGPAKRWPKEYFVEAIHAISQAHNCRFILFGGKGDTEAATRIAAQVSRKDPVRSSLKNLAGNTSLRELCALAKACRLFITNDTGPMHVAAAVGTRVIVPFGSTSARLTGPWPLERHDILETTVPCAPCFLRQCPIDFRCMHQIKPAEIIKATTEAISHSKGI